MAYSVLRRYTPPTCTLEIMGNSSPLSRWAGQPVLKQLRFQLSLDDPKLPKDEWVVLRGDRAQLESLHDAVTAYVQNFLALAHDRLSARSFAAPADAIAILPVRPTSDGSLQSSASDSHQIALQPSGLLNHDLILGPLAHSDTKPVIRLSTLQLFDLANALEEYAADVMALPDHPRSRWLQSVPNWGQVAAACLILVGVSASIVKFMDGRSVPNTPTTSQGASSEDQKIASQLPPSATQSPLPSLSPSQKLPPPPPLGSTVPVDPGMPTVMPVTPTTRSARPSSQAAPGTISIVPAPKPANGLASGRNQIALKPQTGNAGTTQARSRVAADPSLQPQFSANAPASGQPMSMAAAREANRDQGTAADQVGTAFDTIPQVAEARRYFEQRWSPPQGLTQTLEYTLLVGANGSIQRIVPLGQASGDYVDRTNIPLVGEPFVSPIRAGRNAKIRLVLSPDGTVKTFLEGFY